LYLEATGFKSQVARNAFNAMFDSWKGKNKGATIVNAGRTHISFPYLNARWNLPDSNYGT
jgi:hypothetical protein